MQDNLTIEINQNTGTAKFSCVECENIIEIPSDREVGDFFDCPFCGLEYEVISKTEKYIEIAVREDEK